VKNIFAPLLPLRLSLTAEASATACAKALAVAKGISDFAKATSDAVREIYCKKYNPGYLILS